MQNIWKLELLVVVGGRLREQSCLLWGEMVEGEFRRIFIVWKSFLRGLRANISVRYRIRRTNLHSNLKNKSQKFVCWSGLYGLPKMRWQSSKGNRLTSQESAVKMFLHVVIHGVKNMFTYEFMALLIAENCRH